MRKVLRNLCLNWFHWGGSPSGPDWIREIRKIRQRTQHLIRPGIQAMRPCGLGSPIRPSVRGLESALEKMAETMRVQARLLRRWCPDSAGKPDRSQKHTGNVRRGLAT